MAKGRPKEDPGRKVVARNRKARFRFHILETMEAGIALLGTEVKSLREGRASLNEAFARIQGDEIFLLGFHVPEYRAGSAWNHDPVRPRKLLLHRREIERLRSKVLERGFTLVPLRIYFNEKGLAKAEIALARGKAAHDRREDMKQRDARREIDREMRRG
jgi:SsrA-binding protein